MTPPPSYCQASVRSSTYNRSMYRSRPTVVAVHGDDDRLAVHHHLDGVGLDASSVVPSAIANSGAASTTMASRRSETTVVKTSDRPPERSSPPN